MRFWWSSGRNGTTIISNQVKFICVFSIALSLCLFPKGRLNITKTWEKNRYIYSSKLSFFFFFFFFFQKLYLTMKVVLERTKMRTFLVMWFWQRVIHQTIICRIKKSFLGLQYVQELWLLWHIRFTTFKHQPWELASSTEWVSSSLSNQGRTENSSSKSLWAWNHSSLADYLNSTEKHVQICED